MGDKHQEHPYRDAAPVHLCMQVHNTQIIRWWFVQAVIQAIMLFALWFWMAYNMAYPHSLDAVPPVLIDVTDLGEKVDNG